MDFKDLTTKTEAELQNLLATTREKRRELRFKDSNRQLKNVRHLRVLKQEIAQILTALNSLKK